MNNELRLGEREYHLKKHCLSDKHGNSIDANEYHSLMRACSHDETRNDSEAGKDGKLEEESIEEEHGQVEQGTITRPKQTSSKKK